jgi:AraC-like DNA-binding protein
MAKLDTLFYFTAHELVSNVRVYDRSSGEWTLYTHRPDFQDFFLADPAREASVLAFAQAEGPVLVQVNEQILYGLVETPTELFLAGPVLGVNAFALRCTLPWADMPASFPHELQPCSLTHFAELMLLLYDCFAERELTLHDCLMDNSTLRESGERRKAELSQQVHTKMEEVQKHNPYDHERREMACIESGDLQGLRMVCEEQFSGRFGKTSRDETRNGRNLATIVVALATRAAIRGGVLPEVAMSLGDVYMQKIDVIPNLFELGNLVKAAEYELTELVIESKKRISPSRGTEEDPLIFNCKDYIFSHMHSKLTVQDIAASLNVHPNYLSSRFRKLTGMTLYRYILEEKIGLVKNLLIYSEYSYSEIASTLGFTSQSHLGTHFKQFTGLTLHQYRNQYKTPTGKGRSTLIAP